MGKGMPKSIEIYPNPGYGSSYAKPQFFNINFYPAGTEADVIWQVWNTYYNAASVYAPGGTTGYTETIAPYNGSVVEYRPSSSSGWSSVYLGALDDKGHYAKAYTSGGNGRFVLRASLKDNPTIYAEARLNRGTPITNPNIPEELGGGKFLILNTLPQEGLPYAA